MIKIENVEVMGWEHAIRGMRNPKNSWERSDSYYGCGVGDCAECEAAKWQPCTPDFVMGENDHNLMIQLAKGGAVHAKYRRMITVYLDITAPLYWWKEFDTYKVGTVANSCSTMHKIHEKEFTLEDFSCEHVHSKWVLEDTINELNRCREFFNKYNQLDDKFKADYDKKDFWWQIIQLLPTSYNQKRTIMLNYEVLVGMYRDRKKHKLDEWREFCKWIESLPYSEIITREE